MAAIPIDARRNAMLGIQVESQQGLCIPYAVSKGIYSNENLLMNIANRYINDYSHYADSAARGQVRTTTSQDSHSHVVATDSENVWRRVDVANRCFSDDEKYSGILTESPNLSEARNEYIMRCSQEEFPCEDRIP